MPYRSPMRLGSAALACVLVLAACSGSDDGEAAPATTASGDAPAPTADAGASVESVSFESVPFEVFSSDEGAGCAVYVGVPADAVDDSTDLRAMIWSGVIDQDFTTCGFSDVIEVGAITVDGLDSYDQPDWAKVTEHGFFAVEGWDTLLDECHSLPITPSCREMIDASFTE